MTGRTYRGRFAPSPTGPLHFGSLVAALASYLDARSREGIWLVRMEDIDFPRNVPGAASDILSTLEACGLHWDGSVLYQSTRIEAYRAALRDLIGRGHAYPCACSRRESGAVYSGRCRNGLAPGQEPRAWRLRVPGEAVEFQDRARGVYRQDLEREVGDFVLHRADGLFAYQLAVVVDDGFQEIGHVVRGADLLTSTPRQIYLQRVLGLPQPAYLHVPVAVNAAGEKLSKQTLAPRTGPGDMAAALAFLGHAPPEELRAAPPGELLQWATGAWNADHIPSPMTGA